MGEAVVARLDVGPRGPLVGQVQRVQAEADPAAGEAPREAQVPGEERIDDLHGGVQAPVLVGRDVVHVVRERVVAPQIGGRPAALPARQRHRDGVGEVQVAGGLAFRVEGQVGPRQRQLLRLVAHRVGGVPARRELPRPDVGAGREVRVDAGGGQPRPVHQVDLYPLERRRGAAVGGGQLGSHAPRTDDVRRHRVLPGRGVRDLHVRSVRTQHGRSVVEAGDGVVGHRPDDVLEVVAPEIDGRLDAAFEEQDDARVVGERAFGPQVGAAVAVHGLVGPGLSDPLQGGQRAGVQVVERRGAEGRLHRAAERQREVLVLGRLQARAHLRVEAAHRAAGDVVELVVGGDLRVDARTRGQRQLAEDALQPLLGRVRAVDVGEEVRPEPVAGRAAEVAGHRARVHGDVAGVVRVAVGARAAVLVADREVGDVGHQVAADRGVGHEQVGGADQVDLFVEPPPQRRVVGQSGLVVGVGGVREPRAGLLVGVLDGAAERVVVEAVADAGLRAVQRPERHARGRRRVGAHADAAVRAAEAPEGAEHPVGVDRRQVEVAAGPGVGDADVPVGVAAAHLEVAVERPGDPPRARLAAQRAGRPGVPEGPAVEVPVGVGRAGPARVRQRVAGVLPAEGHAAGVVGGHLLDGGAGDREGRVGRRGVPAGDRRVGPQPFQVVVGPFVDGAVEFDEGAGLVLLFDEVVVRRVAEPARPGRAHARIGVGLAAQVRAAGVEDVGGERHGAADRERAGVAQAGPAGAVAGHVRAEPVEEVLALVELQPLAAHPFRGEDQARLADPAPPDARHRRVARAGERLLRHVHLEAPEVLPGDEVGDAADRVGAVGRRRPLLEHFQPADGDARDGVDVDEPPPDEARGHRHVAAAVDQHQRPRGAEAAQVHVGHVLGQRRGLVRVVPAVALADHAVALAEVLHQVDELRRPLPLQRLAADQCHRVGHVDGGGLDGRPRHRHRHFFEQAAELQAGVDGEHVARRQHGLALQALEAGQGEREGVAARGQPGQRVAAVAVGERQAGRRQRGPRRLDGHPRQHAAGVVGHGARDTGVLRGRGARQSQRDRGDQCDSHLRFLHLSSSVM